MHIYDHIDGLFHPSISTWGTAFCVPRHSQPWLYLGKGISRTDDGITLSWLKDLPSFIPYANRGSGKRDPRSPAHGKWRVESSVEPGREDRRAEAGDWHLISGRMTAASGSIRRPRPRATALLHLKPGSDRSFYSRPNPLLRPQPRQLPSTLHPPPSGRTRDFPTPPIALLDSVQQPPKNPLPPLALSAGEIHLRPFTNSLRSPSGISIFAKKKKRSAPFFFLYLKRNELVPHFYLLR